MKYRELTPTEGHEVLQRDATVRVLDVRTEPEYLSHRIAGALLIPVHELAQRVGELDPNATWVVTCEHGVRSTAACEFLSRSGFTDLRNLLGGMAAWIAEGLPADR